MKNPNGYGTVYKLSGNRRKPYVARVTSGWKDGKQLYHVIGYYKTRREGNIALAAYNQSPYDLVARKLKFSEVYEKWSERKYPELSPNRVAQYQSVYRSISEFHNMAFADIRLNHLQDFFDKRTDISSGTLIHYKALFNQLYKFAMKHEIVNKNYAEFIEIKKTGKVAPHKVFTAEEIEVLWKHSDRREVQIILVLIYTGLRITELLTMERRNVFITERYMIGGIKTEAGRDRAIPINHKILPFVISFYEEGGEYLIKKQNNGKSQAYSYHGFRYSIWKPVLKEFGFKHSIHDTRHTAISLMDGAGVNKTALKRIVGHKNEDVTELYTHKTIQELITEIDKI